MILLPFFGKTPSWINYFILSCKINPEIDWLFYSNISFNNQLPPNIHYVKASLEDFNALASEKLGFNVKLYNPYKICDYRPAFAEIFSDYITSYEYWGYCDLDLIFGNIINFLKIHKYKRFDIITSRIDSLAGHFSLFRNCEGINYMYKKIWRFKTNLLKIDKHFYLDERSNYIGQSYIKNHENLNFKNLLPKIRNSLSYRTLKLLPFLFDITRVAEKYENKGSIKILRISDIQSDEYFNKSNIKAWKISWKNGKLYDENFSKEILYFHFIQLKKDRNFVIDPFININTHAFEITQQGIHSTS